MSKKEQLVEFFRRVEDFKPRYFAVKIKMPDTEEFELIVNPFSNFEQKKSYYLEKYDDDLYLKFTKIKILGFVMGDSLAEIEERILED